MRVMFINYYYCYHTQQQPRKVSPADTASISSADALSVPICKMGITPRAPECGHQDEMSRCTWPSAWHTGGLLLLSFPPPPISWHISGTGCSHYSNLLGVHGLSSQHASFQRGLSLRVRLGRQ